MPVVTCPIRVYPSTKRAAKRIAKSRRWPSAAVALDEAVKFYEKAHRASAPFGTNGSDQGRSDIAGRTVAAARPDSTTNRDGGFEVPRHEAGGVIQPELPGPVMGEASDD